MRIGLIFTVIMFLSACAAQDNKQVAYQTAGNPRVLTLIVYADGTVEYLNGSNKTEAHIWDNDNSELLDVEAVGSLPAFKDDPSKDEMLMIGGQHIPTILVDYSDRPDPNALCSREAEMAGGCTGTFGYLTLGLMAQVEEQKLSKPERKNSGPWFCKDYSDVTGDNKEKRRFMNKKKANKFCSGNEEHDGNTTNGH